MLWQGAKWRILKNFNVQNEECHNYALSLDMMSFKPNILLPNLKAMKDTY
jgi:hypothetical protein